MTRTMLNVFINSEAVQLDSQTTIAELLLQQGQENKRVAVAVNGEFVPRSKYSQVRINDNDEIDIVTAVGGG